MAASEHVQGVMKKLLTFGRASKPSWQPTSLNQAVDDALWFVAPSCARAGVRVARGLDPNLGNLIADHEQLCQVVVNLCTNAIRAMPNGGVLTVSTAMTENQSHRLVVEDTGVGISDDVKQKMFQPFFTTHSREGGLGLGLSVVHGIVSSHAGRVDVESEPGVGSRLLVTLPERPPWAYDGASDDGNARD
jgi:signal transduction histidine kinase